MINNFYFNVLKIVLKILFISKIWESLPQLNCFRMHFFKIINQSWKCNEILHQKESKHIVKKNIENIYLKWCNKDTQELYNNFTKNKLVIEKIYSKLLFLNFLKKAFKNNITILQKINFIYCGKCFCNYNVWILSIVWLLLLSYFWF